MAISKDHSSMNHSMVTGTIVKGVGGFYEVWVDQIHEMFTCKAKGSFRREGITPLAGDKVRIESKREVPGQGFIEEILPRTNVFVRPPVANMDQMVIIMSAGSPVPDVRLIAKLLLACELREINPILVINKIDESSKDAYMEIGTPYILGHYDLHYISCDTGEGIEELGGMLDGKITALAGQSGVGKSTLLNKLMKDVRMPTGILSEKIGRGKHTTRHSELMKLPVSGWICDTAGFSQYELDAIDHEQLELYFPEFYPEREHCRFPGCSHLNEPDCALQSKLENGGIHPIRFELYRSFYHELKDRYDNRYK